MRRSPRPCRRDREGHHRNRPAVRSPRRRPAAPLTSAGRTNGASAANVMARPATVAAPRTDVALSRPRRRRRAARRRGRARRPGRRSRRRGRRRRTRRRRARCSARSASGAARRPGRGGGRGWRAAGRRRASGRPLARSRRTARRTGRAGRRPAVRRASVSSTTSRARPTASARSTWCSGSTASARSTIGSGTWTSSGSSRRVAARAQHVEADAGDDGGQPAAEVLDSSVSARLRRSQASCTASSASLSEPSIRYATARRWGRCSSKRRPGTFLVHCHIPRSPAGQAIDRRNPPDVTRS